MTVALWEWSVTRDATGGSVGVSMTRHGAMEALAKALVGAGRPNRGQVVPMILTRPVQEPPYYLRFWPQHTAVYDGQVLQWR
jgi:hypothetical protein